MRMQALAFPNEPAANFLRGAALPGPAARARIQSAQVKPVNARPPTRRTSRRLMPSHRRTPRPRRESIGRSSHIRSCRAPWLDLAFSEERPLGLQLHLQPLTISSWMTADNDFRPVDN